MSTSNWMKPTFGEGPRCTYDGARMIMVKSGTKRFIPPGATDRDTYVELDIWECPKCHANSGEGLVMCANCKSMAITADFAIDAPSLPVIVKTFISGRYGDSFSCTHCIKCIACYKTLDKHEYYTRNNYGDYAEDDHTGIEAVHKTCQVEARRKYLQDQEDAEREKVERAERERIALADKKESERKAAEAREEAERQRRIKNGLCLKCGKSLGFMDKLAGRQSHGNC